jgi:hypothetical protein
VLEDELCDRLGSVVGDEVHRPSTKAKCGHDQHYLIRQLVRVMIDVSILFF